MTESNNSLANEFANETLIGAPEGILCFDAEGRLVFANNSICELLGYSGVEMTSLPISAVISELAGEGLKSLCDKVVKQAGASLECQVIDSVGRLTPIDIRFGLISGGRNVLISAFLRSIVAHDEAERLLQLVAEMTSAATGGSFFRSLVRAMAKALNVECAFITECLDFPATRVRTLAFWVKDDYADTLEYELVDTPCDKVISDGSVCLHTEKVAELFPKEAGFESYLGIPVFNAQKTRVIGHLAFLDTREMPKDFYLKTVFDAFCARAGAELERMQATRELRHQEQMYRLLVENQREVVSRVDADGIFDFVSPSLCDLFGRTQAEMIGTHFKDLVEPADRGIADKSWAELAHPPHRSDFEHRARTDAGWRWLAWSHNASIDGRGNIASVVCVGRDVTARRAAEEKARLTLQELAHLSRVTSMGEMASALAHEINQPLCAILSFAQASERALTGGEADLDEIRHALQRVAANAELAGNVIRQMRSFVRKEEIEFTPVDIGKLLEDCLLLAKVEADDRQIEIRVECEKPLPPVNINATQIEQVILNLLRNARESILSNRDSGMVSIEVRRCAPEDIQVSVRDNGPGIAPELMERLFDPFISSKDSGIGIGLSVCKSIIESHGARIEASNDAHGGACFQFTLPVADVETNNS